MSQDVWFPCRRVKRGRKWIYLRLTEEPLLGPIEVLRWLVEHEYVHTITSEGEPYHSKWGTEYFACTPEKSQLP